MEYFLNKVKCPLGGGTVSEADSLQMEIDFIAGF